MDQSCLLMQEKMVIFDKKWKLSPSMRIFILKIGDVLVLLLSIFISIYLWKWLTSQNFTIDSVRKYFTLVLLFIPWMAIALISDSYNIKNFHSLFLSVKEPIRTSVICWFVYFVIYFFVIRNDIPRSNILIYGSISSFFLILWRMIHFYGFCHNKIWRRIIIIGNNNDLDIASLIQKKSLYYNYVKTIPFNKINTLASIAQTYDIDEVVYFSDQLTNASLQVLIDLQTQGLQITSASTFYEKFTRRTFIESPYLLDLPNTHESSTVLYHIAKKFIDLSFAIPGIVFFSILFPFLAILIKLDSKGSIFFSQIRIGRKGRPFRLWKLRTMTVNTEKNSMWTTNFDPRITRVGKFLRKSRLDELPQFWNVLRGELSIVGVRPLTKEQCEKFLENIPFHNLRHIVTPGITGWAVINQGHVNSIEGAKIRLEYDLFYVKNRNIWLDFLIILRTISTVVTLKGL